MGARQREADRLCKTCGSTVARGGGRRAALTQLHYLAEEPGRPRCTGSDIPWTEQAERAASPSPPPPERATTPSILSLLDGLPQRDVAAFQRVRKVISEPMLLRHLAAIVAHEERAASLTKPEAVKAAEKLHGDVTAAVDAYAATLDALLPPGLRTTPPRLAQIIRVDFRARARQP
jgi:hypothetical protein